MPAQLLSGKTIADAIKNEVANDVEEFRSTFGVPPGLAVVRVGEDPASSVYVGSKVKTASELGIFSEHLHLDEDIAEEMLLDIIEDLNGRDDIDGILVQLPLPKHITERVVLERVDASKDVDGFHPMNTGKLMQGHPGLVPCTPLGVMEILRRSNIEISGKNAVVVGRSNIVGKPMAMLLLAENATVTICHSRTKNIEEMCKNADILVAAIGKPGYIDTRFIKKDSTVIDVGINSVSDIGVVRELFDTVELEKRLDVINRRGSTLVGDVNPKDVMRSAAYYTPVPGGVGLLTVAMLMKNTVTAARSRREV